MELKYELKRVALPIGSEAEHESIDTVCGIVEDFVRDRRWENSVKRTERKYGGDSVPLPS